MNCTSSSSRVYPKNASLFHTQKQVILDHHTNKTEEKIM